MGTKIVNKNTVNKLTFLGDFKHRISVRATEPKSPKKLICAKNGVSAVSRAPKSVQNHTCTLFTQKVLFCTLFGALSGNSGNPTFAQFNFLGDFGSVARTEIYENLPG